MNDILPDSDKVDLTPWSEAIRPSLSLWWVVFLGCRGHRPGLVTESGVPESVAPPARGRGSGAGKPVPAWSFGGQGPYRPSPQPG